MPRRPAARRPRRPRRARKGKKTGKASNNTKVQLRTVYKQEGAWSVAPSPIAAVGQFGYTTYSLFNGSTQNLTQNTEFLTQKQLYDEFCVTKLKISFTPTVTEMNVGTPFLTAATNVALYTFVDRDGQTPVSTAANVPLKIQAYDSFRKHSLLKPWSRSIVAKQMWIDTNSAAIDPRSESGLAQPYTNAGLFQLLGIYAQNLPYANGQQAGTVTMQWSVKFRGKKPMSFTTLPDGVSIVMTPIEAFAADVAAFNPPSSLPLSFENVVECEEGVVRVRSLADNSIVPIPE